MNDPYVFSEATAPDEVQEFAIGMFRRALHLYTQSAMHSDSHGMENAARIIRHVAARLDQYRRVKERQFIRSQAMQPETGKGRQ